MCSDSAGLRGKVALLIQTHLPCQHEENLIFKPTELENLDQEATCFQSRGQGLFSREMNVFGKAVVKMAILIFSVLWV